MTTYFVMIPIGGHFCLSVEAESKDEAKGKAFDVAGKALEGMLTSDSESGAEFQNIEFLDVVNRGNACYFPSPWEVTVDEDPWQAQE